MRFWEFDDWIIFIIFTGLALCVVGVFLPIFIVMAKEAWAWMLSML